MSSGEGSSVEVDRVESACGSDLGASDQRVATYGLRPSPSGPPDGAVVVVRDLSVAFTYGSRPVRVVNDVRFELRREKTLVVVGETGSGKSMTARALLGLAPQTATVSGSVLFEGQETVGLSERQWRRFRGTGIGIVFQDPMRSLNPTMRIGVQISEGMMRHLGVSRRQAMRQTYDLLDLVGIPSPRERAQDYPHQLSGGMRQRVTIAIAVSCKPKVLVADEPTTALDVTVQRRIMDLIRRLQAELQMAVLLITHDMGLAFAYGDEIAVMYGGRIVERGPKEVFRSNVKMPYTRGLLDSVPRLDDEPHAEFATLAGRPPDPTSLGLGCAFAPRCSRATEQCRAEAPLLVRAGLHQWACWHPLDGPDS